MWSILGLIVVNSQLVRERFRVGFWRFLVGGFGTKMGFRLLWGRLWGEYKADFWVVWGWYKAAFGRVQYKPGLGLAVGPFRSSVRLVLFVRHTEGSQGRYYVGLGSA